jgi:hypothetical protein
MSNNISGTDTHDLWVESRFFTLVISRPTPTSVELLVTHPSTLGVVDGAVILLNTSPITAVNYPNDGTQYLESLDYTAPVNRIPDAVSGAQVVSFYSKILANPMPVGTVDLATKTTSFSITITGTDPNTLYYASIHPCTNILQYYPIGVQSYPLNASTQLDSASGSYTGNIPSLPSAPLSPTLGMVYYDRQLNITQYWTGSTWIPTRSDSIITGADFPGVLGQVYLLGGATLKVFNGTKWVSGTSANIQFRVGASWVPLGNVSSVTKLPESPNVGDYSYNYTTERSQYFDGTDWQYPNASSSLFNTGSTLVPSFITPISIEFNELPDPSLGQLFYNTKIQKLCAFNGTSWVQVNTDQEGTPSSDKTGIGNDGTYDERIRLINVLKSQLGYPQTCVELKEEQFNVAIDNALDNFRMWTDFAYRMKYIMFTLVNGQQTYYLNSAVDKTDHIVDVTKIHRLNILGIQNTGGSDAVWSSGILTSYYSAASVDILSLHLFASMAEDFQRMFAGDLTFLWDEPTRELLITRKVIKNEKVILEVRMEKTEQELLVDRFSKQFIQNWSKAELMYTLGLIRSKFTSGTPGAAGPINLNGEMLIAEARQDMTELKQSCLDYEWGGMVGGGNCSFLWG